ncbi:cold shock domain-containing protein [Flavobacterium sp. FlaQc-30]|uniref:cold shock domain-containing protein n=1 Tax=Flavobacterium sp. FlaQc-30 TaxID=3374179 RepID=UPI003757AF09
MLIGLVKWFDSHKGFGVIATPDKGEFFLHGNDFENQPEKILIGMPLAFLPKGDRTKKTAHKVRLAGSAEDWKTIMHYLGKNDTINLEIKITGSSKWGNPYIRKEMQGTSLVGLSLKYFFRDKTDLEIISQITSFFQNELPVENFIAYCELIENKTAQNLPAQNAAAVLNTVCDYFGKNLNEEILLRVWKQKKFKYIARTDNEDYEIPQDLLISNIAQIGIPELNRIRNYSYGIAFCSDFINDKFSTIKDLSSSQIKEIYNYLDFLAKEQQEELKLRLDALYIEKYAGELVLKAEKLETIRNAEDFKSYSLLLDFIPNELNDEEKTKIKSAIESVILEKCSEEYKPELWIKGFGTEPSMESIAGIFISGDTLTEKRIRILSRLPLEKQFELLQLYARNCDFEKTFILIQEFIRQENKLGYYFELSPVLFDSTFWNDKKGQELITLFNSYFESESNEEQRYEMFFKGFCQHVPLEAVYSNIAGIEKDKLEKILQSNSSNKIFISEILILKASTEEYLNLHWLYDLALQYLGSEDFSFFDSAIFKAAPQPDYFKVWEKGLAKNFPAESINEILNDQFKNYSLIDTWIADNAISSKEIEDYLLLYLDSQEPVTNHKIFLRQLNHIKYLATANQSNLENIRLIGSEFYNMLLWVIDKIEGLDFEQLRQKFIYFAPDTQVRILRKLFFLKTQEKFDLTIEKLNSLTRFDSDLYRTATNSSNAIPIDLSTDAVIKALSMYSEKERFIAESELMALLLEDLKFDQTRRFKFTEYFEKCKGRETAEFNWSREGEIRKVSFGDNKHYFAVNFSPGETKWENNRYGGREVYYPNANFENLKLAVKKVSGAKWNPSAKHWGIPAQYETELLEFAKQHRFFLNFHGSTYSNNIHLAEFKRTGIPNGISFCEGRAANKPHEMFKKNFWWCAGQPCFNKCETIHIAAEWEKYTLLDFCEILQLNTDEVNKMGDIIPKGRLYQFNSLINRFNRLLDHLYCKDCSHILYPSDFGTSHFAAHTLVRFTCRNENCSNKKEIYLNHCLNGKCNCIIDSRISKKCSNGLFICSNCGSCCSHAMLQRRLSALELTGGYIHHNLVKSVNEKLGHLERADYFCYKCGTDMAQVGNQVFHCTDCRVTYETAVYNIQRPHMHLKAPKTEINPDKNNFENNDDPGMIL